MLALSNPKKGGCKDGWLPYAGLCYYFTPQKEGQIPGENENAMSFAQADSKCKSLDSSATLATPTTRFIVNLIVIILNIIW